jgi:hypothetical protein
MLVLMLRENINGAGLSLFYCKKGGEKAYSKKVGIHKFSNEEKREFGKKAGLASTLSRGEVPWVEPGVTHIYVGPSEKECAKLMCGNEKYQYSEGPNKGRPVYKLIAERLNGIYHNGDEVRTADKVRKTLNNIAYYSKRRKRSL